jgi:hypothetical protein
MKEKEQPIEPNLTKIMNDIGYIIGGALTEHTKGTGEKYGFALLMFGLTGNESNRMNYICNCNREDMLASMKEFIARNEGRYEEPPDFTKKTRKQ